MVQQLLETHNGVAGLGAEPLIFFEKISAKKRAKNGGGYYDPPI